MLGQLGTYGRDIPLRPMGLSNSSVTVYERLIAGGGGMGGGGLGGGGVESFWFKDGSSVTGLNTDSGFQSLNGIAPSSDFGVVDGRLGDINGEDDALSRSSLGISTHELQLWNGPSSGPVDLLSDRDGEEVQKLAKTVLPSLHRPEMSRRKVAFAGELPMFDRFGADVFSPQSFDLDQLLNVNMNGNSSGADSSYFSRFGGQGNLVAWRRRSQGWQQQHVRTERPEAALSEFDSGLVDQAYVDPVFTMPMPRDLSGLPWGRSGLMRGGYRPGPVVPSGTIAVGAVPRVADCAGESVEREDSAGCGSNVASGSSQEAAEAALVAGCGVGVVRKSAPHEVADDAGRRHRTEPPR